MGVVEVAVLVLLVLAVVAAAGAGFWAASVRVAWRPLYSRRAVVNLKTGRAIDGVLVRRSGDLLFMREAVALEPGSAPVTLDGEAVVARGDVDFIQAL